MRRFAPDWLPGMMRSSAWKKTCPSSRGWVTKALENAQTKVEGHNFDIRKHVVEYDDVMNTQRDVIYTERTRSSKAPTCKPNVLDMVARTDQGPRQRQPARPQRGRQWDLDTCSSR